MEHFAIHKLSKTHTSLLPKVRNSLCCGNPNSAVYFYHSDHLGSASWITNGSGNPVQHLQYMPYGEPFVNERTSSYEEHSYSPLLHYHYVSTSLTMQIPAETLSQTHRVFFMLLCYRFATLHLPHKFLWKRYRKATGFASSRKKETQEQAIPTLERGIMIRIF